MRWEAHGATHRGRVRRRNEDSHLVREDAAIYAVADGMGGHAAGDVASALAIRTLGERIDEATVGGIDAGAEERMGMLVQATHAANRAILDAAEREPAQAGMGTTLTTFGLVPSQNAFALAHIGDSRAYRFRDGELEQLTVDHTWVQRQVEQGKLTPAQARIHPYSSVLTHALGVAEEERVDARTEPVEVGDLFMLCTDGLCGLLEDDQLRTVLLEEEGLEEMAAALISAANHAGGHDNITAVLVRITAL